MGDNPEGGNTGGNNDGTGSGGAGGSGYTPPATQADLDRIIAERISRERGKFSDYDELKAKAQKFDEVEAANQSELEKATKRAAEAEAKAAAFEQREQVAAWAKEITKDSHVPASALRGSTKEELQAHHDQLVEMIPTGGQPGQPGRRTSTPPGKLADGAAQGRAAAALRSLRNG